MNPVYGLFLVTLLASAPAIAEPLDGKIRVAEQRIVCPGHPNRGQCHTIDVKPAPSGCRRVSTGGLRSGNRYKLVCGQG
jgi:hypothetical protein